MSGAGLCETVRMASLTPAERVGMQRDIGSLECGKRADLLVLDKTLAVQRVFIGGVEFEHPSVAATANRRRVRESASSALLAEGPHDGTA